jgi:transposase, IS5 family
MRGQPGFFDVDERLKRLSGLGDHLEAFAAAVEGQRRLLPGMRQLE